MKSFWLSATKQPFACKTPLPVICKEPLISLNVFGVMEQEVVKDYFAKYKVTEYKDA